MDEDELLSRIEMLENQLQFYTQDMPDDSLRKQLNGEEDKRHQEGMKAKVGSVCSFLSFYLFIFLEAIPLQIWACPSDHYFSMF